MCVICSKPIGIEMPTNDEIETMWVKNPDGAGFMYAVDGKVQIEKGFMKLKDLKKRLDTIDKKYDLKSLAVVLHFRITTHGGTKPENTHPFPITDSIGMLKKTKLSTNLGVAHNGIIPVTPRKDISDTMEYIAGQLAPLKRAVPNFYRNKDLLQMILHATDSKLAFLDGKGKIVTVGNFVEHNGMLFSNHSYENYGSYRDFNWEEWMEAGGWSCKSAPAYYMMKLMWLDEDKGEYVRNDITHDVVNGEFAIDSAGLLYEYDYNYDMFEEIYNYNYQAYNSNNLPLKFNPRSNMISEEIVMA